MNEQKNRKRHGGLKFIAFVLLAAAVFAAVKGDRTATRKNGWQLILVNNEYSVPRHYKISFTELSNGQLVDERIYPELQRMFDDMRNYGIYPEVTSGYRTAQTQKSLMKEKTEAYISQGYTEKQARREAEKWVAKSGHSEHQTGLAVDINPAAGAGGEAVYNWLAANAWKYGFIYRYPPDKTEITGINNEPWHYRFVGEAAAEIIYANGLTLEEYIKEYC